MSTHSIKTMILWHYKLYHDAENMGVISIMKVNGVSVVVKEVGKWIKKRIQKY